MPSRPCLRCGVLVKGGSYCQRHAPKKKPTPGRGSGWETTRFRDAVLERAGYRCEAIENGRRCTVAAGLQAHHVMPLVDGGTNDPSNGVGVCRLHHEALEHHSRLVRAKVRS